MKRKQMLEKIDFCLGALQHFVENQNANGLFDINKYCEDIFLKLLNIIYNLNLKNLNNLQMNFPAIDLGDIESEICFQITSTNKISKIKNTLEKFKEQKLYDDYDTIKVLILGNKLKYNSEIKYDEFDFSVDDDILDFKDISKKIHELDKEKINIIHDYLSDNMYKIEGNSDCYYDNVKEITVVEGNSYKSYVEEYIDVELDSDEGVFTLNCITHLINELRRYDENTRSIIQAIIDKNNNTVVASGIYFNREVIRRYLNISNEELNKELRILGQDNHFESSEELMEEFDAMYFMSPENDYEMLSDIMEFCRKFNRDIRKLVMDLDFTILD